MLRIAVHLRQPEGRAVVNGASFVIHISNPGKMRPTGLSSAAEFLANFVNFVAPLHLDEGFPTYGRFYPH